MRTDDLDDYPLHEPRSKTFARRIGAVAVGTMALSMVGVAALAYGVVALGRRAAKGMRLETPRTAALTSDYASVPAADAPPATTAGLETTTPLPTRPSLTGIP